MAKAKLYAADGGLKSDYDLPASHFGQEIHEHAMHLAVQVYLGNQRQGTHKAKNRAEVSGGGKKPWKQKGTGRARQGSNTAPNWARGGKAHGPLPRSYRRDLPKKVRAKALLSALSLKAQEGAIHVFEGFGLQAPKTKEFVGILKKAALAGGKNLILVAGPDEKLARASRNVPDVSVERVQDLHTYALLNARNVIFTEPALKALAGA